MTRSSFEFRGYRIEWVKIPSDLAGENLPVVLAAFEAPARAPRGELYAPILRELDALAGPVTYETTTEGRHIGDRDCLLRTMTSKRGPDFLARELFCRSGEYLDCLNVHGTASPTFDREWERMISSLRFDR
ncbi:MAG: hypothetical protein U0X73_05565 [Thermoanaerobaculia bacterium]